MTHRPKQIRPAALLESLESRRLMSAAHLDDSFGTHGVLARPETTPLGPIAIQKDGKMLLANLTQIKRLRAGGGADTTYAANGVASLPLAIKAIAIQGDGKLLVAGLVNEDSDSSSTNYHLVVARLTVSGKFDRTFGNNGLFTLPENSGSEALTLSLRAGRIVVGGIIAGVNPLLVALTLNGVADITFSKDGLVGLGATESVASVSIAKNGSITALTPIVGASGYRTARVTATGAFDITYSGDGISPLIKSISGPGAWINGDGSMLVTGVNEITHTAILQRITKTGKLDTAFGSAGTQNLSTQPNLFPAASIFSSNGTCYLFGESGPLTALDSQHIFLARISPTDHLDTSFATQGLLTLSPHHEDDAFSAAFSPDSTTLTFAAGAYSKPHLGGFSSELIRVIL